MLTKSKSTTTPPPRSALSKKRLLLASASSSTPERSAGSDASPEAWHPAPYQLDAAKFLVSRGCAGLFMAPGLRKTSIVLAALKVLMKKQLVRRTLIVAPPRVCRSVWPHECQKWADFSGIRTVVLHGAKKDALLEEEADVYLVSFQSLEWLFGVTKTRSPKTKKVTVSLDFSKVAALGVNCLVVDEVSKARNYAGITAKILKDAREQFDRVYALTGSPRPKSMMDLFGVMQVIDGGYSLGAFITHYRNAYFYPTGYGGHTWELKDGAEAQIYKRIADFVYRLDDKALLDLPELVTDFVNVDLPAAARKAYDEIERDFLTVVDDYTVAALNSGVSSNKCSQIANGGLYKAAERDEDGRLKRGQREWLPMHDEKTEAVVDLLEELNGSPALVMYEFGHDLERLLKVLGANTPRLGGGVSPKESDKVVAAWNRGELPYVLCHPGSMGHGLNMQGGDACHVIWHSITWDYELYDQTVRRLLRSGNKAERVFSHLLVSRDTVDEAKAASLRRKEEGQNQLLAALADYTARRSRALGVKKAARSPRK